MQRRPPTAASGTDLDYLATLGEAPGLASPQLFAYTLPNVFLGEAAIRFGLTGPTVIVSDEEGTGAAALETALDYIAGGGDTALAGICDLARPAQLPERPDPPPGALFLVLERRPTREPLGALSALTSCDMTTLTTRRFAGTGGAPVHAGRRVGRERSITARCDEP